MTMPRWLPDLLGGPVPEDGGRAQAHGVTLVRTGEVLRAEEMVSEAQGQTRETFAFKWHKRDTYEGALADAAHAWLFQRYGDVANAGWLADHGERPVLLDAGCGAAFSALELWTAALPRLRYIGADISAGGGGARPRVGALARALGA